ncbi:unnamed protein product [Pleuronectes platessa]|uniref:Uncharacterized protein n=1 Tax=Pleuronectes platessa TaxID=8262 RepID=A0A9N7YTF0_PLEPL|nr:unnamed protein product [Pleuronectes platessa]
MYRPNIVAPSPISPRHRRLGVWPASTFFFGGGVLVRWASLVRGAFFLLDRGGLSVAGVEGGRVRRTAATTLDACRALLADHLRDQITSEGAPHAMEGSPSGRLGWRLAADLQLVRTRGIRRFNYNKASRRPTVGVDAM